VSDDYEPPRLSGRWKIGAAIAMVVALAIPGSLLLLGGDEDDDDEGYERTTIEPAAPRPDAAPAAKPEGKVVAIDADGGGTCALLSSGQVMCMGDASIAELGDERNGFTLVPGIARATAISVGDGFACALEGDAVRCWGSNHLSKLGGSIDGRGPITTIDRGAAEVRVRSATGCARMQDGTVECWGYTLSRVAGTNREPTLRETGEQVEIPKEQRTPAPIPGATGATALLVGQWSACIRTDDDLLCWGSNMYDLLGTIDQDPSGHALRPVATPALRDLDALALGSNMACGLDAKRRPTCTGTAFYVPNKTGRIMEVGSLDEAAALQDRLTATRATPRHIPELDGATAFSLGEFYACALLQDRTVRCWDDDVATPVPGLTGAVAIATGRWHSCALVEDGRVRCWLKDNPSPQDANGLPH
jgi:hypothetical protein